MKTGKISRTAGILMLSLACTGAFFAAEMADAAEKKAAIAFSESTKWMEQGSSAVFHVKVSNAGEESVVWKSSNSKVLKVSANGKVKAKAVGEAVIKASLGKASVTKKVTVYPSLEQISETNDVAVNLDEGVYSTVSVRNQSQAYEWLDVCSRDGNGYLRISSGSSVQVSKGNLDYYYSMENGIVSVFAAQTITAGGVQIAYHPFSNEEVMAVDMKADTYKISTEADIAGMTTEEQQQKVGISDGIIQKELVIDKKTGLLQEYTYTIQFDKKDADFKHVSHLVFSYNENAENLIPRAVRLVMDTDKTRTVTIISSPGTVSETKNTYVLPASMPLYITGSADYYTDKECTRVFTKPVRHEDGTYDSYTLYTK